MSAEEENMASAEKEAEHAICKEDDFVKSAPPKVQKRLVTVSKALQNHENKLLRVIGAEMPASSGQWSWSTSETEAMLSYLRAMRMELGEMQRSVRSEISGYER